ncbi:class I SAM-dependent methyltransferase [Actinomarinicola tropica]|uniref:Methyltransferase domain-containing protein n=1 Tax=Actinomarinicola tropica TaxID=2789776 RepID=A0A5Q2RRA8_9ACTN|nr:class I SAM-dependent methyltransferase [Actinomarinicola tropica]QGG95725.1 methyltransferase domain-containing protein [Actinomarinicola tropica]
MTVDHYADRYWNDLPAVLRYMQRRATGDPATWWMDHFKATYATPPRRRGLVIGCGNGWVERDLFDRGVCEHFDAFDFSADYLVQAEAAKGDRSISYRQSDFRSFRPEGAYDLIVNVAALHHAQHLWRHVARLADALTSDGVFVHWEYVGPRRNQYPRSQIRAMERVRDELPERFRTPHALKPSRRAAVLGDPTEAVHSDEIVDALEAFFEIEMRRDVGGGIAYQLLWNFTEPFEDEDDAEAQDALQAILRADEAQTGTSAVPPMFTYIVARPRTAATWRGRWRRFVHEPVRESLPARLEDRYPGEAVLELAERAAGRIRARTRP